jgi:hypothetical protein
VKTEPEDLLHAVLGEMPDARSTTLELALNGARHRRRARVLRRGAVAMAAIVAVGFALWPRPPGSSLANDPPPALATGPLIVRTAPLPDELLVNSRAEPADTVHSIAASISLVRTSRAGAGYRSITDDELMDLVAGQPAALVSVAGQKRLVIAGEAGWPVSE